MNALRSLGPIAVLALLGTAPARAVPDLRFGRLAGPLRVFPDDRRQNLFYYPPGQLTLVSDASGRPEFQLLELRYTGTDIEGDTGVRRFRNIVSMRLALSAPTAADLRAARLALGGGSALELRPLPISRLEAVVVYTPVGGDSVRRLPPGHFEAEESTGLTTAATYWTERVFTLRLDNATAALFEAAIRRGLLVLSVGYAFFARGIGTDQPLAELTGSPELVQAMRERTGLGSDSAHVDSSRAAHLVQAGALAIHLDVARWPDLVRQVDLNAQMPPGYPAVVVYCYDFRDSLDVALSVKLVEFQAVGVGGHPVSESVLFNASQPDLYAQAVRFPFAVRLSSPFRYRVVEVLRDGMERATPWAQRDSWSGILDVTLVAHADSLSR
ncbi:MAG TPA: hypothetical protein VEK77_14385 [Gemmatimonadales bacterium]|nr:hypothetical protein [Gemmatimonadales bacterium]